MTSSYPNLAEQELQAIFSDLPAVAEKANGPLFGALTCLEEISCRPGEAAAGRMDKDQEVLTLMLEGTLVHKNATGTLEILPESGVQLISAGDGQRFSEFNPSRRQVNRYLRIGFHAPVQSRMRKYEQLSGPGLSELNQLSPLAQPFFSPLSMKLDVAAWVWFGLYEGTQQIRHALQAEGRGVYGYLISGQLRVDEQWLTAGDHFAVADIQEIVLETRGLSQFVLIELPR